MKIFDKQHLLALHDLLAQATTHEIAVKCLEHLAKHFYPIEVLGHGGPADGLAIENEVLRIDAAFEQYLGEWAGELDPPDNYEELAAMEVPGADIGQDLPAAYAGDPVPVEATENYIKWDEAKWGELPDDNMFAYGVAKKKNVLGLMMFYINTKGVDPESALELVEKYRKKYVGVEESLRARHVEVMWVPTMTSKTKAKYIRF